MSALSYRSWDIWINTSFVTGANIYNGYYECAILNTLMVSQSIEFLVEKYEIRNRQFVNITFPSPEIIKQVTTTEIPSSEVGLVSLSICLPWAFPPRVLRTPS